MAARATPRRLARALAAALVLVHAHAGRLGGVPLPSAHQHGARACVGGRARLASSAVHAAAPKKKAAAKKAAPNDDPAAYFAYLSAGEDRTEEDTSPPADIADPDAAIAPKRKAGGRARDEEAAAPKARSKSSATAESIASAASEGYLDLSEELRWYLVQCTPGFERSIGRGLAMKAELAGYGADVRARARPVPLAALRWPRGASPLLRGAADLPPARLPLLLAAVCCADRGGASAAPPHARLPEAGGTRTQGSAHPLPTRASAGHPTSPHRSPLHPPAHWVPCRRGTWPRTSRSWAAT